MSNIKSNPWSFTNSDASLFTVTGTTETNYIATATTAAPHGYAAGDLVVVAGITPAGYNGLVRVLTVPLTTTFTYGVVGPDGVPVTGLGAGGAGTTGKPAYVEQLRAEDMSWQNATAGGHKLIVTDINGNIVWSAVAPTAGNYSRTKPYFIRGLWIQEIDSGTLVITVN